MKLKLALSFTAIVISFLIIEIGYRIFDPFPYFNKFEINSTDHGNLSAYHPRYGWSGIPSGEELFVTYNNRVHLKNNAEGFRDIEHNKVENKPAIVFLGDSFTWGYEVEFDEMFVNLFRNLLPEYEIFNLAHRGYGTDQELLVFQDWHYEGPLKWVILMFSENDVSDNNSTIRYHKPKPQFEIIDNRLSLTGVPVPEITEWVTKNQRQFKGTIWIENLKIILFKSHFIHDLYARYRLFMFNKKMNWKLYAVPKEDLTVTEQILEKLNKNVEERGAKLILFIIPSKIEIENLSESSPYQEGIIKICRELGIKYLDLAGPLSNLRKRAYFRIGRHMNANGHEVVAHSIYRKLTGDPDFESANE